MRIASLLGVVGLMAVPVSADPYPYHLDASAGIVTLDLVGFGSTTSGLTGTFDVTIYQSDRHIGESDTFVLTDAYLFNTDHVALGFTGVATANVLPGSLRLVDFMPDGTDHIGPGGIAVVDTDIYFEATILVTGQYDITFDTATSTGALLPLSANFLTSAYVGDTVVVSLEFAYVYDAPGSMSLDIIVCVEGTARVPEPGLVGTSAIGMAGASVWLRRRRT